MAPNFILLSPLQMEKVTKILIKMGPLSTDGAILILVFQKEVKIGAKYLIHCFRKRLK